MPNEIDVRLERVTKMFADVAAVDDLSLDIEVGEFFSLLGPSVCGKVASSLSWHSGVGESRACAAPWPIPSSEVAANAPAPSTMRRVGVSIMRSSTLASPARLPGAYRTPSAHRLQLVDHAGDNR